MKSKPDMHLWCFLILTFAISWGVWLASGVLSRGSVQAADYRWLIAQVGVFGPSFAALVISATISGPLLRNSLRILPILLLTLLWPGLVVAANAVTRESGFPMSASVVILIVAAVVVLFFSPLHRRLLLPGTGKVHAQSGIDWLSLSIVLFPGLFLIAWVYANGRTGEWGCAAFDGGAGAFLWALLILFSHNLLLGGSLGEEVGWRGFLLPRLLERHTPFMASLWLALVWALWHLPIDLSGGFLVEGPGAVVVRIIWTIPLAILFTWFYQKAKGNLLVPLFLHTSINILPDLGFSNYEGSMVLMFLLMLLAASVVTIFSAAYPDGSEPGSPSD